MTGKLLYEYAVIRIVPRVERQEFLNAGILLYCKDRKFLGCKWDINEKKLACFDVEDTAVIYQHLKTVEDISAGQCHNHPINPLGIAERFRWLTAARSTVIQTSKVHIGFTADPQTELEKLFEFYAG